MAMSIAGIAAVDVEKSVVVHGVTATVV